MIILHQNLLLHFFLTNLDYVVPEILCTFVFLSHLLTEVLTDKLTCLE